MRVAVIGAGVAGSACTWRLASSRRDGLSVTLFEMGRGAGGRAGTRHVKELPGLHINHGAPLFHMPSYDEGTKPLLSALLAGGYVQKWRGACGGIDSRTGVVEVGGASRGEEAVEGQQFVRYEGAPGMSSVAKGCLELACKSNEASLQTHFGTRIKELKPKKAGGSIVGWELLDKDGKSYGDFDWVVMSGATPALERWRGGFHEDPPVWAAAQASGSELFKGLVSRLDSPLPYDNTHVVMMAWDVSANGKVAEDTLRALRELPFRVTQVSNDEDLAKICVQSTGPDYAVVTLHSTKAFATKHKKVMGSGSFVSVSNKVEGSVASEQAVSEELFDVLQSILAKVGVSKLPSPSWGPALHRWGAAFPEPDLGALGTDSFWLLPGERFIFSGDFLAPPNACVASAMRSGLAAGDALLRHMEGQPVAEPKLTLSSSL